MPAATEDQGEEISGFLNVRYKGGKKFRWKRKYAVLKNDAIHLSDEKTSLNEDTSELRLPGVFNSCGVYNDKKARKKFGFVLEPIDTENQEQWYFTCDDLDQQQKWLQAINDIVSGHKVQKAVSCPEFDEIIVQTTTLQHLAKDRPKFHGRRLPAKRPRSENALNGIPENADTTSETPDSSLANSPARDFPVNGASTSAPASPASKAMKDSSPAVKRREKKRGTFLRGIGARVSRMFGTQPPRSPTSPARLDHETAQPRVPIITTTDSHGDKIAVTKEEEEEVPDVVTKEDIIKMLDFVSETTEQAVYTTVEIRGTISSVDEAKSKEELRSAYRSLRKAVNSLKGTTDGLSKVEEILQSAPELVPEKIPSPDEDKPAAPVPLATVPLAVDELDQEDQTSSEKKNEQTEDSDKKDDTDKPVALNESLESVEDFDERKQSVSLMEAIQNTLNGAHSISAPTNEKVEEESASQIEAENKHEDETTKDENEEKESKSTDTENMEKETKSEDKQAEVVMEKDQQEENIKEDEVSVKEENKSVEAGVTEEKQEQDDTREAPKTTDNE